MPLKLKSYYLEEYNPELAPLITLLMCYRYSGDAELDIIPFFRSFIFHIPREDWDKFEFIIKVDTDDIEGFTAVHLLRQLYRKLCIRIVKYDRWSGRANLYLNYALMFSKRNTSSKFIGFVTGDSVFVRNFLPDLLKHEDTHFIFSSELDNNVLEYAGKYRVNHHWAGGGLTELFPIVTCNIIEICGGMGWQSNIDNWLSLLNVVCYHKHGVMLYRKTAEPYIKLTGLKTEFKPIDTSFNDDMYVSVSQKPKNQYYFDLVEQQAKNIVLNIKYGRY